MANMVALNCICMLLVHFNKWSTHDMTTITVDVTDRSGFELYCVSRAKKEYEQNGCMSYSTTLTIDENDAVAFECTNCDNERKEDFVLCCSYWCGSEDIKIERVKLAEETVVQLTCNKCGHAVRYGTDDNFNFVGSYMRGA